MTVLTKTFVSYQTIFGSTKEAASMIVKTLEDDYQHQVDIHQFEENKEYPDISGYDNIVIGSCIFHGRWGRNAEEFLKQDFKGKKLAIYICAGFAGEKELYEQALNIFLRGNIEKYTHIKPVSIEAFGGRVPKSKIPRVWFLHASKRLENFRYDNRDLVKVKNWAHKLGKIFAEDND